MKARMHVRSGGDMDADDRHFVNVAKAKATSGQKTVMAQPPTGDERTTGKIEAPYTRAAAKGAPKSGVSQGTAGGAMKAKSPVTTKNAMVKNFNTRDYGSK